MTPFEQAYQQWRQGQDAVAGLDKLFVLGCAKSGTTWLADLLHAHPQVVVRGEGCFTWRLVPILSQAFQAFNQHQKNMDPVVHLRDLDLLLAARSMIDGQFLRYLTESGKDVAAVRVVGDKTPQHTVSMPLLHELYPRARFVHILRDPRDVATSAWFHFGQSDRRPFEEYIHYYITQVWPLNVRSARQVGGQLAEQYMEVRYEDLKADAAAQLTRVLEFIDARADPQIVQACLDAASFEKKSGGRRPGTKDARSFYRSGTSGDWRNHLPVELAQSCCDAITPLMRECGYDPVCTPAENHVPQTAGT